VRWRGAVNLCIAATLGCDGPTAPPPRIQFQLDSPTCGGPITFAFSIDGVALGQASLSANQLSPAYTISTGQHTLRAVIVNGNFEQNTVVHLERGEVHVEPLAPYCS
jgi:hypothetical protein